MVSPAAKVCGIEQSPLHREWRTHPLRNRPGVIYVGGDHALHIVMLRIVRRCTTRSTPPATQRIRFNLLVTIERRKIHPESQFAQRLMQRGCPHTEEISGVQVGGPLVPMCGRGYPERGMVLVFERLDEISFGGGYELGDVNDVGTGREGSVAQLVHK